jgi:hypothetical protein
VKFVKTESRKAEGYPESRGNLPPKDLAKMIKHLLEELGGE